MKIKEDLIEQFKNGGIVIINNDIQTCKHILNTVFPGWDLSKCNGNYYYVNNDRLQIIDNLAEKSADISGKKFLMALNFIQETPSDPLYMSDEEMAEQGQKRRMIEDHIKKLDLRMEVAKAIAPAVMAQNILTNEDSEQRAIDDTVRIADKLIKKVYGL